MRLGCVYCHRVNHRENIYERSNVLDLCATILNRREYGDTISMAYHTKKTGVIILATIRWQRYVRALPKQTDLPEEGYHSTVMQV